MHTDEGGSWRAQPVHHHEELYFFRSARIHQHRDPSQHRTNPSHIAAFGRFFFFVFDFCSSVDLFFEFFKSLGVHTLDTGTLTPRPTSFS